VRRRWSWPATHTPAFPSTHLASPAPPAVPLTRLCPRPPPPLSFPPPLAPDGLVDMASWGAPPPDAAAAAGALPARPVAATPPHPVAAASRRGDLCRRWLLPAAGAPEWDGRPVAGSVMAALPAGLSRDGVAQAVGFAFAVTAPDGAVMMHVNSMVRGRGGVGRGVEGGGGRGGGPQGGAGGGFCASP